MGVLTRAYSTLKLTPIFGCRAFGADTKCSDVHHGPIPRGSRCCCMVCSRSGMDSRTIELVVTQEDEAKVAAWKPPEEGDQWSVRESGPASEPTAWAGLRPSIKMTRRQRRDIECGRAEPPPGYELDPENPGHLRKIGSLDSDGRGYIEPMDPAAIDRLLAHAPA